MSERARLLIVDDHTLVRTGIRGVLVHAEELDVVGEAADGQEAVELAKVLKPNVILMDLVMPGTDGVEATRTIIGDEPETRIVILTGSGVDTKIFDAIQAGAFGYVDKAAPADELIEAVRRVARGEPSIPYELTRKLLGRVQPGGAALSQTPVDELTEREAEIAALVATGRTNQQIADEIFISEGTVRTHMSRILSKLQVSNRVEVALYALRSGLASLDP